MKTLRQHFRTTALALGVMALTLTAPAAADFVINDDLIVDGSACIGFDCVNNETFGFDTIRLKENNLRIKFEDTSVGSFPTVDWQLTANSSTNGGQSKFSIDDISAGRTPFTVEANAPSNSIYADDGGRIGFTTSLPVVELHVVDGDTPTLRLEQDGSSGFEPQTWDVAGNETNFFIRDVTNGSTLPLRIRPSAPSNSVFVDVDGDVGLGTSAPAASLHVLDADPQVLVESNSATSATRVMIRAENEGRPRIQLQNTAVANAANEIWNFEVANNGNWVASLGGSGTDELQLAPNGDLTVTGDVFSATCGGSPCAPDYVFEEDYELMPIPDLQAFLAENKHLPNVPPATELAGPINMSKLQLTLLEKIEELTLYTIDQESKLASQDEIIRQLQARLETLEATAR